MLERNSRPIYIGEGEGAELRKSGEDVDAKGLTEWMWDVLYWTWGCTGLAAVVGDWAWWFWVRYALLHVSILHTRRVSCTNENGIGGDSAVLCMAGVLDVRECETRVKWDGRWRRWCGGRPRGDQ